MAHHGQAELTGYTHACQHANPTNGRFRRLFPDLPPLYLDPRVLQKAGRLGGPMTEGGAPNLGTQSNIPLGYCFLGQFIDHDITLDVSSSTDRVNDPEGIENVRTPVLDLDCVYGQGPEASRHQYFHSSSSNFSSSIRADTTFLTGTGGRDLPRHQRAALIGDHRNDENRVVSQLQLIFLQLHNQVHRELLNDLSGSYKPRPGYGDYIRAMHSTNVGGARHDIFEDTRQIVRWHYQWVVVQDFLKRLVGEELVDDILCNGRKVFTCKKDPFIPVEFAVAAYRYGHTQVPDKIAYNAAVTTQLFRDAIGNGFDPVPGGIGAIDWGLFFGGGAQMAGAMDTKLAEAMLDLPFIPAGSESSLAVRNLLRAQSFRLPSGQAVAAHIEALCGEPIERAPIGDTGLPREMEECTPLWLYVLAEGLITGGERLGPVGGRLVAEVLIGLLECDPTSYLGANRNWVPDLMRAPDHRWDMEALINFAQNGDYA